MKKLTLRPCSSRVPVPISISQYEYCIWNESYASGASASPAQNCTMHIGSDGLSCGLSCSCSFTSGEALPRDLVSGLWSYVASSTSSLLESDCGWMLSALRFDEFRHPSPPQQASWTRRRGSYSAPSLWASPSPASFKDHTLTASAIVPSYQFDRLIPISPWSCSSSPTCCAEVLPRLMPIMMGRRSLHVLVSAPPNSGGRASGSSKQPRNGVASSVTRFPSPQHEPYDRSRLSRGAVSCDVSGTRNGGWQQTAGSDLSDLPFNGCLAQNWAF